jgi:hypothetical protein
MGSWTFGAGHWGVDGVQKEQQTISFMSGGKLNCAMDLAVMLIQWSTIVLLTGTTRYNVSSDVLPYVMQGHRDIF